MKVQIDHPVRLAREIPELALHSGDEVIVRSVWFSPNDYYEIEFSASETELPARRLVSASQLSFEDDSLGEEVKA